MGTMFFNFFSNFRMSRNKRAISNEEIDRIIRESIPSDSSGEESDTDDNDCAQVDDNLVLSSESEMEVEECNEDNCNENQGMNAPKWKKKTIQ